ncbi:calcium/proton exchanger [Pisolithus marmoratus]|nr:calcium/proton exchanger [Pisolithus marmoratus]
MLLQPEKRLSPPPSSWQSLQAIVLVSWLNVLLVCVPVSWVLNFALPGQHVPVFIFSFLAIIPLVKLLAFATDELSIHVGQTLAGLMNVTLVCMLGFLIIALTKCDLEIVQSSLVGSILSKMLLILGMCFFAGGLWFLEQGFRHGLQCVICINYLCSHSVIAAVQVNSSLLAVSIIAVLLPGAFHMVFQGSISLSESDKVAIILLFVYCSYILFQLFSHKNIYNDDVPKASRRYLVANNMGMMDLPIVSSPCQVAFDVNEISMTHPSAHHDVESIWPQDQEEEQLQMTVAVSIGLLVAVMVLVAVTTEFLVDSINGLTSRDIISNEFVAVILLPIIGSAVEQIIVVTVPVKDKLMLSLGMAVGSSIQVALFVIPFLIITLGWILGKPLTLMFNPLESIVMFLTVLTVNYVIQDGRSNWLKGMVLMSLYLILCVTFWYYPGMSTEWHPLKS